MTARLAHDRAIEELELVALGAAPPDVAAGLRTHATSCEDCRRELATLTIMLADMTDLFPDRQLNRGRSAGIRSRLLARADADSDAAAKRRVAEAAATTPAATVERRPRTPAAERGATPPHVRPTGTGFAERAPAPGEHVVRPQTSPVSFALRVWAAVATVALIVALAALFTLDDEPDPFAPHVEPTEGVFPRVDSLERLVQERDMALEVLAAPAVRIISLTNRAAAGRPLARMFWDPRSHRWTLFVYELRPPREGRVYQLWLHTADGIYPSASFTPDAEGRAVRSGAQQLSPGSLRTVTVTEELPGGSHFPSGPVVLAGSAPP